MPTLKALRRYGRFIGGDFGCLTLKSIADRTGDGGRIYGLFKCSCGRDYEYELSRVVAGKRWHCGCQIENKHNLIHGMRYSREYSAWQAMKRRCLSRTNKDFRRWGGTGVTVCKEWADSFEAFFMDVGPRPSGTSIDRIDNTRGYEPGNVRWATARQQAENRRNSWVVEANGITYPSIEAAAIGEGVSTTTIVRWCMSKTRPNYCRRRRYLLCQ